MACNDVLVNDLGTAVYVTDDGLSLILACAADAIPIRRRYRDESVRPSAPRGRETTWWDD